MDAGSNGGSTKSDVRRNLNNVRPLAHKKVF